MKRKFILAIASMLAMAGSLAARPRIDVGSHSVGISAFETIDVYVTGGDPLQGIDMLLSIGDEGNGAGLPADLGEPKIVSVDVVSGTIFAGNSTRTAPGAELLRTDQVWEVDTTTLVDSVAANGKIFTLTLDTRGVVTGSSWPLRIFIDVPGFGGPYFSNYSYGLSEPQHYGEAFEGSNGSFIVHAPEPATVVLAAMALIGLVARGRRGAFKLVERRVRAQ